MEFPRELTSASAMMFFSVSATIPSFSNGAAGYSQESASIAWDQMFERQEGMDVMEVARALTRAYVQKQGDQAGIDVRTSINQSLMSISSYASDSSAASKSMTTLRREQT
eukprot:scaffold18019_cov118-Isochrysis_galbana.AAC.6